ncbi:MAG: AAA family ATPase [Bacteroidales bacterium]
MSQERLKLNNIHLKGFKSINNEGQDIPFGDITLLLGANGSGKSNLISFFKMVNYMTSKSLQTNIAESGFADSILYYGSKKTPRLSAKISFANSQSKDEYFFSLSHAAGDTLILTEETLEWEKLNNGGKPFKISLDPGSKESGLLDEKRSTEGKVASVILSLIRTCQVFQFHDTSKEARIRNASYIDDANYLRSDAGNLAAFLYSMKQQKDGEKYYQRIVRYIQKAMPQFKDFVLKPSTRNENYIMLNWTEKNSDYLFGSHQISDGSLRFMALTTLLMQPPKSQPKVIILDEPELGLHPAAITQLGSMIKTASQNSQVVLATQSTRLIDEFEPKDIVIVERDEENKCSTFKKLDEEKLNDWLERYSISELWEKNVIGGRP